MSERRFRLAFVVGLVVLAVIAVLLAPGGTGGLMPGATQVTGQSAQQGGGFTQSQSEATGQQSSQQVVDRVEVTEVTGTKIRNGEVGVVRVTVRRSPGASAVDLSEATVRLTGENGNVVLDHEGDPDASFGVASVHDADGSLPVLNDAADRATLVIDLGEDDVDADGPRALPWTLAAGESGEIAVSTDSGTSTVVQITVPEDAGDGPVALS